MPDGTHVASNIYVIPEFRRQHIGTKLVDIAKKRFPDLKVGNDFTELGAKFNKIKESIMTFKEFYLNEMLIVGKPLDGAYVVAFDKWIWILSEDDENKQNLFNDIADKLKMDEPQDPDVLEFIRGIQEKINDVLIGTINGKNLYLLDYGSFKLDPKSSILVNKVVKQLKLNSASYTEDLDTTETKVPKKKMTMQIPDVVYHGTSSKYLERIMSIGLRPSEADSNYASQGIYHEDLIFFATRIGEAMHHAVHTAVQKGGIPVILEMRIPDKNLVIADYDVEKMTNKPTHYVGTGPARNVYSGQSIKQDSDKLSKEFGVYGYKGNIKPIFIKNVYVATEPADDVYDISTDFKKMKPKSAIKNIEYLEY